MPCASIHLDGGISWRASARRPVLLREVYREPGITGTGEQSPNRAGSYKTVRRSEKGFDAVVGFDVVVVVITIVVVVAYVRSSAD